jgi:menaquinone-dependent protoporphyrinogen oxidase
MPSHVLVAYASREGSTAEIAETIGMVLREAGAEVDVLPVKEVHNLDGYDAVVLGSAVHIGKVLPEAVQFAKRHQPVLADLPVAYFVGCDRMREDMPQNRQVSLNSLRALQRIKEPMSVGLFAGKRDLHNPNSALRWLLARINVIEGDWRDWSKIRAWAHSLTRPSAPLVPPGSNTPG